MTIMGTFRHLGEFTIRSFRYIARGNPGQIFRDIRSWWHFRHQAWRDVLTYDEEKHRYRLDRHTLVMREIVPEDLAVTGQKYHYFYTDLEAPERHDLRTVVDEDGTQHTYLNTSAISNYLYMKNNDINEAMAGTFKNGNVNPMVVAGLIGVAIVGVILWLMMGR